MSEGVVRPGRRAILGLDISWEDQVVTARSERKWTVVQTHHWRTTVEDGTTPVVSTGRFRVLSSEDERGSNVPDGSGVQRRWVGEGMSDTDSGGRWIGRVVGQ